MIGLIGIFIKLYHTKENKGTTTFSITGKIPQGLYHTKENKGTTTKNLLVCIISDYTIPKKIRELQRFCGTLHRAVIIPYQRK